MFVNFTGTILSWLLDKFLFSLLACKVRADFGIPFYLHYLALWLAYSSRSKNTSRMNDWMGAGSPTVTTLKLQSKYHESCNVSSSSGGLPFPFLLPWQPLRKGRALPGGGGRERKGRCVSDCDSSLPRWPEVSLLDVRMKAMGLSQDDH